MIINLNLDCTKKSFPHIFIKMKQTAVSMRLEVILAVPSLWFNKKSN